MNSSGWEGNTIATMGYSTVETLLAEVSNNMAASSVSRHTREQSGQRKSGSMRVVKPNSTNNSPRNSTGLGRRMTDGAYRRRLAMMEQETMLSGGYVSSDTLQYAADRRAPPARPVSWHPASHLPFQQPPIQMDSAFQLFDLPRTPAAYSGYTTPALALAPFDAYHQEQYPAHSRPQSYNSTFGFVNSPQLNEQHPTHPFGIPTTNMDPSMYSHFDWSNFATNGFEIATTAPPTPEDFLPIQHPESTFPSEDTIPYHALDDSEDEGEELIGMGLYDGPEDAKSPSSDPQLDNYRALMMSQLMGTAYCRPSEPSGKGLKLEETWAPPPSDDEEEDDSEQDGEGEDEDEIPLEGAATHLEKTVIEKDEGSFVGVRNVPQGEQQTNFLIDYNQGGWL